MKGWGTVPEDSSICQHFKGPIFTHFCDDFASHAANCRCCVHSAQFVSVVFCPRLQHCLCFRFKGVCRFTLRRNLANGGTIPRVHCRWGRIPRERLLVKWVLWWENKVERKESLDPSSLYMPGQQQNASDTARFCNINATLPHGCTAVLRPVIQVKERIATQPST